MYKNSSNTIQPSARGIVGSCLSKSELNIMIEVGNIISGLSSNPKLCISLFSTTIGKSKNPSLFLNRWINGGLTGSLYFVWQLV